MLPLQNIKILFRAPDTLALYGVPYEMRPGQQPGDLWRAGNTKGWIWLGSPGWWGNMSPDDQAEVQAFLSKHHDAIPGNPYEWDRLNVTLNERIVMAKRTRVPAGKGTIPSQWENPSPRVRKPIQEIIDDLKSWLPNYDHGPNDYPTVLYRILASAPGGDELEDIGYEPFNLGWQELDQLGRVLVAIQDKRDVEDIVAALTRDEEEERLEEVPRLGPHPRSLQRFPIRRGR
jgi:hypothetical protein